MRKQRIEQVVNSLSNIISISKEQKEIYLRKFIEMPDDQLISELAQKVFVLFLAKIVKIWYYIKHVYERGGKILMSNKVDFPKLHEIPTSVELGWEILESIKKSPKTKGINEELITKLNYVLGRLNASIERYEIKYHYHTNIEKGAVEAIDSLERLRLFETLAMYKAVERRFKIENKKGNSIQKKTYKQLQLSDELFEKIDISKTSEYLDPVLEVELSATIKYIDKKIEDARIKIVKAAGNKNRNIALSNLNSLLLLRKNVNAIYEKENKKELLSKEVVLKKKKY